MINFKQKELIENLFKKTKKKFPEIEFINITESPEDSDDLWVNILFPEDEDRKIKLMEYAANLETDILLDYGYHIMLMPALHNDASIEVSRSKLSA